MRHGFVRVAAVTPDLRVADTGYNVRKIIEGMEKCAEEGVKICVFPELSITGYTCGELFLQDALLEGALEGLDEILAASTGSDMVTAVGLPFVWQGKLYNTAVILQDGEILGMVPKTFLPSYAEFYEERHFSEAPEGVHWVRYRDMEFPFGTKILFACEEMKNLVFAAELCEDLWAMIPPSTHHAAAGARIILNLSASSEGTGKDVYRRELVKTQSARLVAGYIYANAGTGESTTDLVFGGQSLIAENGVLLAEKKRFQNGKILTEIDVDRLSFERRRMTTWHSTDAEAREYEIVPFSVDIPEDTGHLPMIPLTRTFSRTPFVPGIKADRDARSEEITTIQAMGLAKRLDHTHAKSAVIGLSGGLDSTLALLVTCKAFDILGMDRANILAVTMPCFGTTDRTYQNALDLAKEEHVNIREIDIKEAVSLHFRDIGHDPAVHDVTYENSQARERTQILMDLANQSGGMVIGTGDLSELALGWATYNGDHMSMYGVNASIPKTLVRYLVLYFAETAKAQGEEDLSEVLFDILDTPVSPELLPPEQGQISQKTEDLVGPYELHDFFLYYVMRCGFTPDKVYRLACYAFRGAYDEKTIHKWLVTFYGRFFSQQYKRSCIPDGPKVGSVALSPRGDWRMPSDACVALWREILNDIEPK